LNPLLNESAGQTKTIESSGRLSDGFKMIEQSNKSQIQWQM